MGKVVGHSADAPLGTTTAGGGGKSALVTAHITKLQTVAIGSDMGSQCRHHCWTEGKSAGPPHALGTVTVYIEAMYSQKGDESRGQDAR